jgi:hypothetical protein
MGQAVNCHCVPTSSREVLRVAEVPSGNGTVPGLPVTRGSFGLLFEARRFFLMRYVGAAIEMGNQEKSREKTKSPGRVGYERIR